MKYSFLLEVHFIFTQHALYLLYSRLIWAYANRQKQCNTECNIVTLLWLFKKRSIWFVPLLTAQYSWKAFLLNIGLRSLFNRIPASHDISCNVSFWWWNGVCYE